MTSFSLFTQTGIKVDEANVNRTPDASAILDAEATTKGILVPRIALTAKNIAAPVVSPAHSLIVFNTTASGTGTTAVDTGLYYWDTVVSEWVKLITSQDNYLLADSSEWVDAGAYIFARKANQGGNDVVVRDNGRMGIGNNNPASILHIDGNTSNVALFNSSSSSTGISASNNALVISNDDPTNGNYSSIWFNGNGGSGNASSIIGAKILDHTNGYSTLDFLTTGPLGSSIRMRIDTNGKVGVGMAIPEELLVVNGISRLRGELTTDDPNQRIHLELGPNPVGNSANQVGPDGHFRILTENSVTGTADDWLVFDALDGNNVHQDGGFIFREHNGFGDFSDILTIASGQQGVGIFTNTPVGKFQVVADEDATQDSTLVFTDGGALGVGTNNPTFGLVQINQQADNSNAGLAILNSAATTGLRLWMDASNNGRIDANASGTAELLINSGGGNVGIGTTNPVEILEVSQVTGANMLIRSTNEAIGNTSGLNFVTEANGAILSDNNRIASIRGIITDASPNPLKGAMEFRVNIGDNTDPMMYISSNSNVGIGTITPTSKLNVVSTINNDVVLELADQTGDATVKGGNIGVTHYTIAEEPMALIGGEADVATNSVLIGGGTDSANAATSIYFYTAANNTTEFGTAQMRITGAGDVGIGVLVPSQKLDVIGNIRASGNFISGATTLTVPDYVFETYYKGKSNLKADYEFKSLEEIENFTKEKGHLPGIPSAKEVTEKDQFNVTQSSLNNLEKIEELYLHVIKINKEKQELQKRLDTQEKELKELKELILKQDK